MKSRVATPDSAVKSSNTENASADRPRLTSVFADVVLPDRAELRRARSARKRRTMRPGQPVSRVPRIPTGLIFADPSDPLTERALRKIVGVVIVGASEEQREILLGRKGDLAARQRVLGERFNEWRQKPREPIPWPSPIASALAQPSSTRLRERPLPGRRAT